MRVITAAVTLRQLFFTLDHRIKTFSPRTHTLLSPDFFLCFCLCNLLPFGYSLFALAAHRPFDPQYIPIPDVLVSMRVFFLPFPALFFFPAYDRTIASTTPNVVPLHPFRELSFFLFSLTHFDVSA